MDCTTVTPLKGFNRFTCKKGHSWIESNFGQMPLPTVTCMGHCKHQTWVYLETVHHINHCATDPYSYSINTKDPMLTKPLTNGRMG